MSDNRVVNLLTLGNKIKIFLNFIVFGDFLQKELLNSLFSYFSMYDVPKWSDTL